MKYDSFAAIHLAATLLHIESPATDCKMITDAIREMRSTLTLEQGTLIARAARNAGAHTLHIEQAIWGE